MLFVDLPYPPSVNTCWRSAAVKRSNASKLVRGGFNAYRAVVYMTKEGKLWRQRAVVALRNEMWKARGQWPMKGEVAAAVVVHAPDGRVRNIDNLMKALFDACTHAGVWTDDDQISRFTVSRGERRSGGAIALEVAPL